MIQKLFAIRDQKSETYNIAFIVNTHGEAEREFVTLINTPNAKANKFPEDFDLYYIASYDLNTGKLNPESSPQHVVKGVDLIGKTTQLVTQ